MLSTEDRPMIGTECIAGQSDNARAAIYESDVAIIKARLPLRTFAAEGERATPSASCKVESSGYDVSHDQRPGGTQGGQFFSTMVVSGRAALFHGACRVPLSRAQLDDLETKLSAKQAEVNQIAQMIGKAAVEGSRRLSAELVQTEIVELPEPHCAFPAVPMLPSPGR